MALQKGGANIAAILYLYAAKAPATYQKIVQTIQRVAPYFHDFVLRPNPLNPEQIRLQWRHEKDPDRVFTANDLSDGTLRFICLTTLLLQPQLPALLILDEPELGLHPDAIHLLAGMIKSAAAITQIIVATQSVTLVNAFDCKDIIVVEQKNGTSTFTRRAETDLLCRMDQPA